MVNGSITKARHILRLWMEKQLPICKVAANILNIQSQSQKGVVPSLAVRQVTNNPSLYKLTILTNHSKMAWKWRKPHNEGFYDLGNSPLLRPRH
jgi:hypothetical protein